MTMIQDAIIEYNAKKRTAKALVEEKFKAAYMYALWRKYMKNSTNAKLEM